MLRVVFVSRLLLGADKSFIFTRNNDDWIVNPNVQLSHITHVGYNLGNIQHMRLFIYYVCYKQYYKYSMYKSRYVKREVNAGTKPK